MYINPSASASTRKKNKMNGRRLFARWKAESGMPGSHTLPRPTPSAEKPFTTVSNSEESGKLQHGGD